MKEAVVVFSRRGMFATPVAARDVHSHEHARKLWPLVTPTEPRQLVTWVKPTFVLGKLKRRSHFRILPNSNGLRAQQFFEVEEATRYVATRESPEHLAAKNMVAEALRQRLKKGIAMPWYFKDPDSSQFHLAGNLLLGAQSINTEEPVKTVFGCSYRLDVAILSKQISKAPILLGGVEIEWEHQFDGRKALIGKSQGFPLISIDISGITLDQITPEWADAALTATTRSNDAGQRKTYIYLHDLLYPLYLQLPSGLIKESRHQFVVFAPDDDLSHLEKWAKTLQDLVGLPKTSMAVSIVNAKSEQSRKMLENAGQVVGHDWQHVNSQQCLRLTVERPGPIDVAAHMFHLCIVNLFLLHSDSLVGYKYMTGILNEDSDEDVWQHPKWNPDTRQADYYRILPKRLAEPRSRILSILNTLGQTTPTSSI